MHSHYFLNLQSIVPMRREPKESSEMVSQLLFGEYGHVLESRDSFVCIKNHFDAYVGWVDAKMVLQISLEEYNSLIHNSIYRVCAPCVEAWNDSGNSILRLPAGAILPFFDPVEGTFGFGDNFRYRVLPEYVNQASKGDPANIVSTARLFLNAPYLWGGKNIFGIDCSGLVQVASSVNGYLLPRDANQQVDSGQSISQLMDAMPGDLAFFEKNGKVTHVGILISSETIIHASGHVKIEKIDDNGIFSSVLDLYTHHLFGIRRLY